MRPYPLLIRLSIAALFQFLFSPPFRSHRRHARPSGQSAVRPGFPDIDAHVPAPDGSADGLA